MNNLETIVENIKTKNETKETLYTAMRDFLDFQEKKYLSYAKSGVIDKGELPTLIWLGVERAISTYHAQKNCKFLTWAGVCIKFTVLNEYKKQKNSEISLDMCLDEETELSLAELIPDPKSSEKFENAESALDGEKAMKALKKLSPQEQQVITLTCIKNISLAACAREMNISVGRARSLRLTALKKLKGMIM